MNFHTHITTLFDVVFFGWGGRWEAAINYCICYVRVTEEVVSEGEKNLGDKKPVGEEEIADAKKEGASIEPEEKEPEDKEPEDKVNVSLY